MRETLRSFCSLDFTGLAAQFVVVDNNSTDCTKSVVHSFKDSLTLSYIFEPRPGKNCALNHGIEKSQLGDIVIFTDDDVTPASDWLLQVVHATLCYPEYAVFGGKIIPRWPDGSSPKFVSDPFILMFGFSAHAVMPNAGPYPMGLLPFGPNFWLRGKLLENGFKFNEGVGPRPRLRIMGSESTFLSELRAAGYEPFYSPSAVVEHRIQRNACTRLAISRRAVRLGRGEIYISGYPRTRLRRFSLKLWFCYALIKAAMGVGGYSLFMLAFWDDRSFRRAIDYLRRLGNALECLRIGNRPEPVGQSAVTSKGD